MGEALRPPGTQGIGPQTSDGPESMNPPSLIPEQLVDFWMGKVVEWGQALTPEAQLDVALNLSELKAFLQRVLRELQAARSTDEVMRTFPFVGQLLGRLCWNSFVTADEESRGCLLQCLHRIYSAQPQGAVERKANQWIENILCHLLAEEDSSTAQIILQHVGRTSRDYHLELLRNMVALLMKIVKKASCSEVHTQGGCLCDRIHSVSVSCIPLVTCPEAAPLIGALLQYPAVCSRAALSKAFLETVNTALLGKRLMLEEQAVFGLWCSSLVSLERAVLHLLESTLLNPQSSPRELEQLVARSPLPRASALCCPVFLVVNDIFRVALLGSSGNQTLHSLLQAFTRCFLRAWGQLGLQERLPLKAFFPNVPPSLLMALMKHPSELPEEVWPAHLLWIIHCLQRAWGHEEEAGQPRWRCDPLDCWLLLVQNGHWVDVAAQLLVTLNPDVSAPLVWLLTLYHHPDDDKQNRVQALAVAEEALLHLRVLFPASSPPPPHLQQHVQVLVDLVSSHSTAGLVLRLALSFCVFSSGPVSVAVELLGAMKVHSDTRHHAIALLAGFERGLNIKEATLRMRRIQDVLQ